MPDNTNILRSDRAYQRLKYNQAHIYAPVGAALLRTSEKSLGDAITPEVKAAWTETCTALNGAMTGA